ncbi:MAG: preprotein translocase subunit SecG [Acidobacteria bacterium]|nr:preprotein translocase subunit SecG [Acidobacteriota bacterium]MCL5289222.1 preprotein translocase subunit SecG [Acidobacteriota bacterium]
MPSEVKWFLSFVVGGALIALGWKVPAVLITVHVLLCFLLIVVVLLQSGKAADLAGAFGGSGSQTAFGPRGAATFLSKATTWCAIMFMVTSMSLVLRETRGLAGTGDSSVLEKTSQPTKTAPAPFGAPVAPAQGTPTTPATGTQPAPQQPAPQQQAPAKPTTPPKK